MIIKNDKLIGLRVQTQRGTSVGKITGFSVNSDGQTVYQYFVKPEGFAGMFAKELIISTTQVISISEEKMVVDDNIIRGPILVKKESEQKRAAQDSAIASR